MSALGTALAALASNAGSAPGDPAPAETPAAPPAPSAVEAPAAGSQEAPPAEAAPSTEPPPAEARDYKVELEKVEKERIAPLMSERDTMKNERDTAALEATELRTKLADRDEEWEGWLEYGAQRNLTAAQLLAKVEEARTNHQTRQTQVAASRSESTTIINGLYRGGESDFANYLHDLMETDPQIRVNAQNLERHRSTFSKFAAQGKTPAQAAAAASADGSAAGASAAAPAAAPAGAPKTPPKVPGAGGPPGDEPAWNPQAGRSGKSLLGRALGMLG